jgi:hypothetical protein
MAVGRDDIDAGFRRGANGVSEIGMKGAKNAVNGTRLVTGADAEAKTGVTLRISIDDQYAVAARTQLGRQIDRHGRFAGAAFFVGDGQGSRSHGAAPARV